MKLGRMVLAALIVGGAPLSADANIQNSNVTIAQIVQWESTNPIYFKLSNDAWCYIQPDEKNLYALILTLYSQKTSAEIHCYDQVDTVGGIGGHRLHRIVTAQ